MDHRHHHSPEKHNHRDDVPYHNHGGHQVHGGPNAARDYLRRALIVTGLLVPLFVFSMVGQMFFQYPDFAARRYVELGLSSLIFGFGFIFFEHAKHEISSRKLGMMTLVSLAVGSGFLFSVASTFIPALETEFNLEIATLIWVLLFGHYLEAKSSAAAGSALDEVAKLLPKQAHVKHAAMVHDMDITALEAGMVVIIKPGEKAPADGVIVQGRTHFNEAHLSGESKPIEKTVGDRVVAGAIAVDGSVEVTLDKVGSNSTIGQISALIASAKQTKPSAQRLADKAATLLTITAVVVAILTVLIWSVGVGQPLTFSLTLAITVLVIACPHALGLAIPTVSTIATKKALNHGIFIKDMGKLEVVTDTDYVIFDKTGTLTAGTFSVAGEPPDDLVQIAASLEAKSSHVIGVSIGRYAAERKIGLKPVADFISYAGKGVAGTIDGKRYLVGNRTLLTEQQIPVTAGGNADVTQVYVADERELLGVIQLADEIKPEAKKAIDDLHQLGIKVAMITGDNEGVAGAVADRLGIDTYFANVLPEDKYQHVKMLQEKGNTVLMVGDGVNDAPALTQANVGIAIGAGTDVAVEAGDVVLTHSNPNDIPVLIMLSNKVYQKMYQNLWWALGYNIVAIPAAAGVFIPWGFQLRPQVGALAMALSSVIVVINAMSLRKASLTVR